MNRTKIEIEWVKEIVKACDKADIPVFLKDNLKPLFTAIDGLDGRVGKYFIEPLRQELPDER